MTVADLEKSAPGFDFATYFKGLGAPVDSVIVAQPSAVTGIAKLVADAPIGVLQDQLMVRSLDGYADVLPQQFDDEQFAFYGKTLSGTPEQQARWKRGVQFTTGAIDDEVSKIYVGEIFPARDQGGGRRAGQEHHRGDGRADRQADLDGARDQGEGAREARRLHPQDRLSVAVEGLFGAEDDQGRCVRQRMARQPMAARRTISAISASRCSAGSGG